MKALATIVPMCLTLTVWCWGSASEKPSQPPKGNSTAVTPLGNSDRAQGLTGYYRVKRGESLSSIAAKDGVALHVQ